ncbi:hypothetical protein [Massilia glaciei]|uniref:Uncharacterized protein n=1 Tax=Massilia glaciei TaxID=1524097 RepID=A0A2U2HHY7_9BURK|nr:hypothetical protein [Massilia glaciei]PWF45512.1 hypothetical protein C7C56_017390 [Massilia glaciei]
MQGVAIEEVSLSRGDGVSVRHPRLSWTSRGYHVDEFVAIAILKGSKRVDVDAMFDADAVDEFAA